MQDDQLLRAVVKARVTLTEVLPLIQRGPGGPRTLGAARMAVEALDRVRPAWEAHFGPQGQVFSLDRLVYLPNRNY